MEEADPITEATWRKSTQQAWVSWGTWLWKPRSLPWVIGVTPVGPGTRRGVHDVGGSGDSVLSFSSSPRRRAQDQTWCGCHTVRCLYALLHCAPETNAVVYTDCTEIEKERRTTKSSRCCVSSDRAATTRRYRQGARSSSSAGGEGRAGRPFGLRGVWRSDRALARGFYGVRSLRPASTPCGTAAALRGAGLVQGPGDASALPRARLPFTSGLGAAWMGARAQAHVQGQHSRPGLALLRVPSQRSAAE